MNDLHKYAFDYRNAVLPDDAQEALIDLEEYVRSLIVAEREACAKVCEAEGKRVDASWASCAFAIRERGAP